MRWLFLSALIAPAAACAQWLTPNLPLSPAAAGPPAIETRVRAPVPARPLQPKILNLLNAVGSDIDDLDAAVRDRAAHEGEKTQ